jgi:hypothetical protein
LASALTTSACAAPEAQSAAAAMIHFMEKPSPNCGEDALKSG